NLNHLSNLTNLNLSNNKINRIENLDQLNNLESLNLSSNQQISKIENLDLLPKLKSLYLYDLSIERIEGLDALISLESLGIASNVKQYLDIEGLANLKNLKQLQIEQFKLFNNGSAWFKNSIKAFRFISMIKQNNYLEIEDWKQVFIGARWVFGDDFLCNNSKYQQKWLYDQCTPKILDILEKILNEPEFEDIRRGYERQWEDLLEEAKKYLFQPPKIPIDYTERRRIASEKMGDREFCVYVKRPDYQIAYIYMAYLIEDLIKENIIPDINPYDMEISEELKLQELKYYTSLTHIGDFSIRLTPTEEFKLFFKNEMQYVGKLKLKLKLFDTDKDLLDRIGTPLGTNFLILSIPFSQEIWSDYALNDIIQDENDYYGFYRTKACQIFEKKYEKFLDYLKEGLGDEIGTGFYLKKRKKPREVRFTDLIFGRD
ncbi:MAG: leucine-rich repeat domain-containing protein, partial [Candidatus Hodarchaeota archaeon]